MPKQLIEKDAIVATAYALALDKGLASISMRAVATACDVAVGSIYNYFPSKNDLVAAIIARFFHAAFYEDFCNPATNESFLSYCGRLFVSMRETLARFRSDWLLQIRSMEPSAREAAKQLEADRLVHVRQGMQHVLANDPDIRLDALPDGLDADALCSFVLQNMLHALREDEGDCKTLFALIERALYNIPRERSRS